MLFQCHPSKDEMISGHNALMTAGFVALGLGCGFEMLVLVGATFRRWSGLYFWSLIVAALSMISFSIGNILYYWVLKDSCPGITLLFRVPGYLLYVPSEFLVLYSRLHLVQTKETAMRVILSAVIAEWVFVEIPLALLTIGATLSPSSWYNVVYIALSKVEWVLYVVIDCILSGVYIFQVKRSWASDSDSPMRLVLQQVVVMTIFLLLIDFVYFSLWFTLSPDITVGLLVRIPLTPVSHLL
jgi:hypothetical protein